jgi:6-phosphogluconate dehydrogenase
MLATLGRVWAGVGMMKEGGNAGRLVGMGVAGGHGGWGGAGVIPSILPTCSGTAVELSSARSPAAGAVHWRACLRIVHAGGAGWPWFAMNRGGVSADANWIRGSWARRDDLPVVV